MDFLPDGRIIVTERDGRLRTVTPDGVVSAPINGVPAVFAEGQGGLLDVGVSPKFASDSTIYISYAEPGPNDTASTAVARATLKGDSLQNVEIIFRQLPKVQSFAHFGSRFVFTETGDIFITLGERGKREQSQDLSSHLGKFIRLNSKGEVPQDNPFIGRADARPEIWSYGHRNMQGAAINPWTKQVWTSEHGAQGGDELNIPEKGKNYGWPVITWGIDYNGSKIGEGTEKQGMEHPVYYWTPSIAPSGMAFYSGSKLPRWKGSLFVGSLKFSCLIRLTLSGNKVTSEERLLTEIGDRIRDVRQGPDELLYVLTDMPNGRILRISP